MKNFTLKIALVALMMGVGCGSLYAQQVRGTVKNTAGDPVVGATVMGPTRVLLQALTASTQSLLAMLLIIT